MRLVRQYRTDTKQLIFRISIFTLLLGLLIFFADRVAFVAATYYFDSRDAEHDNEILRQSAREPTPKALQALIAQKQGLLQKLSNEATKRRVSAELANLYERSGANYLQLARDAQLNKNHSSEENAYIVNAEDSYQHAIAFAPFYAEYYVNLAKLYYRVSLQQKDMEIRCGLLKNSIAEFQDGIDREPPSQRAELAQEAATKLVELAKLESAMPKHHGDALPDLQKALKLALPGSALAGEINRTIRSLGTTRT